jgi:hypothetical protein
MQEKTIIITPCIYILVEDSLGINCAGYICNASYGSRADWSTSATTSTTATRRYFVTTVGVERERILKYVEYQQRQDSGQAKLEL